MRHKVPYPQPASVQRVAVRGFMPLLAYQMGVTICRGTSALDSSIESEMRETMRFRHENEVVASFFEMVALHRSGGWAGRLTILAIAVFLDENINGIIERARVCIQHIIMLVRHLGQAHPPLQDSEEVPIMEENLIKRHCQSIAMVEKKLSEEEVQEKFVRFKAVQEQIEQLQEQLQLLHQHYAELENAKETLAGLQATPEGTEILTPIASGIFMKTALLPVKQVILNVGADIAVEKNVEDVVTLVTSQKKDLTIRILEVQAILQELQEEARDIYLTIKGHTE